VHANILLNLLRGDWLRRIPDKWETAILIIIGLLAGALAALRPSLAVASALIVSFAIFLPGVLVRLASACWFDWMVRPQSRCRSARLVGRLSYLLESRRRKELRRAFGFYLSPQMADKIADSDFDLTPGGKVVDVTVIFTDLESFTSISEDLDPAEVSEILTSYFEQTTKCILENKGKSSNISATQSSPPGVRRSKNHTMPCARRKRL